MNYDPFAVLKRQVDRASAVLTASGNSGAIVSPPGLSFSANIDITVFTGTSLDIVLQDSVDGSTWNDVYHVERITATGTFYIPPVALSGQRRYVYTFTGTTTTFDIEGTAHSQPVLLRNYYDRTIVLNTLNSVTSAVSVTGCKNITAGVSSGTAAVAANVQLELSVDKVNWFLGTASPLTLAASSVRASAAGAGLVANWARLRVATAGTTNVLDYAFIHGNG